MEGGSGLAKARRSSARLTRMSSATSTRAPGWNSGVGGTTGCGAGIFTVSKVCVLKNTKVVDAGTTKYGAGTVACFPGASGPTPSPFPPPAPSPPPPFGPGTFPIDSIDLWQAIMSDSASSSDNAGASAGVSTGSEAAPLRRTQLVLGHMSGGAMVWDDGFKIILGAQSPDWWYGPYSPNCTDGTGGHDPQANCADGCLYHCLLYTSPSPRD